MSRLKVVGENLTEQERASFIQDLYQNQDDEVDYEFFLKVCSLLLFFNLIWERGAERPIDLGFVYFLDENVEKKET